MRAEGGFWIADCGSRIAEGEISRDLTVADSPWRDRRSPRFALTLFELLLVLVLLTVMGSLAAPLLHGSFSTVRLRRSTDQVLAAWISARTKAVETGRVFQFRFIAETGQYRVEPWVEPWSASSEEDEAAAVENELLVAVEMLLPEGIELVDAEQRVGDRQNGYQAESLLEGSSQEWSRPILFFPDGTSTAASLLLRNQQKQHQRATLRALTGIGRASAVLSKEQLAATR